MSSEGKLELNPKQCYIVQPKTLDNIISNITNMSQYAYEYQTNGGYITINGGHRIGICGDVGYTSDGRAVFDKITSVNIRFCKTKKLFKDDIFKKLYGPRVYNTCILSPPGCGKTTFLKNFVTHLDRFRPDIHICIADERNEIRYSGLKNTSVLSNCNKAKAVEMFVRCMNPGVIVFDELWSKQDFESVREAALSGVPIVYSMHGTSYSDAEQNKNFILLKSLTDKRIQLSRRNGAGTIEEAGCIL